MKAQITWEGASPTAEEVAGKISTKIGRPVLARTKSGYDYPFALPPVKNPAKAVHYLEVEESDFPKAVVLCNELQATVKELFGIASMRHIDGWDLGGQACIQYRRRFQLEDAVGKAINQLKVTRSWFKDKRIAEIRRDLEKALALPIK